MSKSTKITRFEELVRENERLLHQVTTLEQEVARLLKQTNECACQTGQHPKKLLDQRVDDVLELSVRSKIFLSEVKIIYVGQLIARTTMDLHQSGSGTRICRDIVAALEKINISLGTDVGKWFAPQFR